MKKDVDYNKKLRRRLIFLGVYVVLALSLAYAYFKIPNYLAEKNYFPCYGRGYFMQARGENRKLASLKNQPEKISYILSLIKQRIAEVENNVKLADEKKPIADKLIVGLQLDKEGYQLPKGSDKTNLANIKKSLARISEYYSQLGRLCKDKSLPEEVVGKAMEENFDHLRYLAVLDLYLNVDESLVINNAEGNMAKVMSGILDYYKGPEVMDNYSYYLFNINNEQMRAKAGYPETSSPEESAAPVTP